MMNMSAQNPFKMHQQESSTMIEEEEDDGGINVEDGMEMAPSETSSIMHEENNKQYMNRIAAMPNTPYTNSSS
jgi:hypothetical protein